MDSTVDSTFIRHIPCEACGSSDANGVFTDGHTYCFSCTAHRHGEGSVEPSPVLASPPSELIWGPDLEVLALPKRGLTEKTCRHWGYSVATYQGVQYQVATYRDAAGTPVAQKLRGPDKTFKVLGNGKKMPLYGMHLWGSGKRLIVTEGELDALSMSQLQDLKWPVVSIPNGAAGAPRSFTQHLEYFENFETVVIMFDNDAPGIAAAKACAAVLPPGKARIASLPLKDANEMLVAGRGEEAVRAFWNATPYRPDGILDSAQVLERVRSRKATQAVCYFPFTGLDEMTKGYRPGEIVTICGGSGLGKSEVVREIALTARQAGLKIGYVALEESVERTALGLVGMAMKKQIRMEAEPTKVAGFQEAWDNTITDHLFLYDHFGSLDSGNLIQKLRYLRVGCGVDVIVLDHISIVVSGNDSPDERREIDKTMTALRQLSEETRVPVLLVSHLKQPTGVPLEEGGKTSLSLLRGSRAIGQLSDTVIGLERDQQDDTAKDVTTFRLLKCRWTGETGYAGKGIYSRETGRITTFIPSEVPQETPKDEGDARFDY